MFCKWELVVCLNAEGKAREEREDNRREEDGNQNLKLGGEGITGAQWKQVSLIKGQNDLLVQRVLFLKWLVTILLNWQLRQPLNEVSLCHCWMKRSFMEDNCRQGMGEAAS